MYIEVVKIKELNISDWFKVDASKIQMGSHYQVKK